jgi:putative ABC transport system permease protein
VRFLPLLVANLRRKKARTVLTMGSFFGALLLFALLAAVRAGLAQGVDVAGADRLVVIGRTGLIQPLPLPYYARLQRVPGVQAVAHSTWFGGVYQDPKNFFPQFAVDPDAWRSLYPEFRVDAGEWEAFKADRQGIVIGRRLAQRFGWKVGDRVPIKAPGYLGGAAWEFNVRGVYRGTRRQDDETQMWMQHRYLYEKGPAYWKGLVGWYVVRVADPASALAVARAVDAEFANSPSETRTQTESAFAAAFVNQMGNVELLILSIGSVVFFTLLLVSANTMAVAVRERTAELAVLKALGYPDRTILGLVLAESLLIAAVGGGLGLGAGRWLGSQDLTNGILLLYVSPAALAAGVALALATGLVAGLGPAVSALRLSVTDALRRG